MNDWYVDLGFSVVFSLLKRVIKNPSSKADMRSIFRKIYAQIELAYPEIVAEFHPEDEE
jgi:hypothetical protein